MSRLTWVDFDYEAGVDRGVLYIPGKDGVPWNGLISVDIDPSGGDVESLYVDGYIYKNHSQKEDFVGSIEAYTYPDEFSECDGVGYFGDGMSLANQEKKSFGLSYRTMINANDYKIHIVYGVIAYPFEKNYHTQAADNEVLNFEWGLFAKPLLTDNVLYTSYFVIDSRKISDPMLDLIERFLYGSDVAEARLPSMNQLYDLFSGPSDFIDAGYLHQEYFETIDSGEVTETQTDTIDGGGP